MILRAYWSHDPRFGDKPRRYMLSRLSAVGDAVLLAAWPWLMDKPQRYISLGSRLKVLPARLPHGPGWGQAPALHRPLQRPLWYSGLGRRTPECEGIPFGRWS